MGKTFQLLESKNRNTLLADLEKHANEGWQLESFNIVVINKAEVFYALLSNVKPTEMQEMALEEELQDLNVGKKGNGNMPEESGKYQK